MRYRFVTLQPGQNIISVGRPGLDPGTLGLKEL
jgi:hypothetical protein